jgi:integrase
MAAGAATICPMPRRRKELDPRQLKERFGLHFREMIEAAWLSVDLAGRRPMLRIPGDRQKSGKDELYPIAPEFAEMLLGVPEADRTGRAFKLPGDPRNDAVSDVIASVGKQAGIKVKAKPEAPASEAEGRKKVRGRSKSAVKYASAHDLRRSFCERWAARVMPQVLMQLARHESIETTMKFYVGRNAEATADVLYEAVAKAKASQAPRSAASARACSES